MSGRDPQSGVILVNVLVALAIASSLVVLMLTSQDALLDRARRVSAAQQAEALALGAETSMLVALRRDMDEAPEADHYGEAWALIAQREVELAAGRFSVEIRDARARLDLNALAAGGLAQEQVLSRLVQALGLPEAVAGRILRAARGGDLTDLSQVPGLDAATTQRLDPHVLLAPVPGMINLNTAEAPVIGAVLGNAVAARRLVALRERNEGQVGPEDLTALGLIGGAAGFTSDLYDVTIIAEVDGMAVRLDSRLLRQRDVGRREVVVISRRFGAPMAPPPPEAG